MIEKLVRDKIPDIVIGCGETITIRQEFDAEARKDLLWLKLKEEIEELRSASGTHQREEELADVITVLCAICNADIDDIRTVMMDKEQNKGGFDKFYVMEIKN